MAVEVVPAHDIPLSEQARVVTEAFEGYIGGSFTMMKGRWRGFFAPQGASAWSRNNCDRRSGHPMRHRSHSNARALSSDLEGSNWPEIRRAFSALIPAYPNCEFFAPAVFPEEFGREIFAPLGSRPRLLRQFLMRRDL
jgi:hypothetical protein